MDFDIRQPLKPFNGGHVVVALKKHFFSSTREELLEIKRVIDRIILKEKEVFKPEGFNILFKGEEIHIIPRWCGDINVAFFGGIKVIPISPSHVDEIIKTVKGP